MWLLSELWSSGYPLKMSLMCIFRGLACGVLSTPHLLKVARSRRARPLFRVSTRESLVGSLVQREFVWNDMGLTPSTPSW